MPTDGSFQQAYRELEEDMKALAAEDGDVFVPNPAPEGPVQYVLICPEPSFDWADSRDEARAKVEAGFHNFVNSREDFLLHFSARRYLCDAGERYHLTDLSKGAMPVDRADVGREERYDRWYPLLRREMDLVATSDAEVITVGKKVSDYLAQQSFPYPFTRILHYSPQARRHRNAAIEGREDQFRAFKTSISMSDVRGAAEQVLRSAGVPTPFRDESLSSLKGNLTASDKKLIFIYKETFESIGT